MALGITRNLKKFVFPADKRGIFNISAQIEETETPVNSDRDWEILYKTEERSTRGILKEKSHFWKNELKPALIVQNMIDNGYIMPCIYNSPVVLRYKQQIQFNKFQIHISGYFKTT